MSSPTDVTDGLHPSAFHSSVIPPSVAISVGKTKKPFADGFTDGICVPKKKRFPLEIYRRIFSPSEYCDLPTENNRR
jgi:hypothetical protein